MGENDLGERVAVVEEIVLRHDKRFDNQDKYSYAIIVGVALALFKLFI